jgi:hypothetical protein
VIRLMIAAIAAIAGCSSGSHGAFTVGDAVHGLAPAACMRLQRCGSFPYDTIDACIADLVQRECAARDCDGQFAGTEADVEACAAALDAQPCVTTEPLPMCLGGSP